MLDAEVFPTFRPAPEGMELEIQHDDLHRPPSPQPRFVHHIHFAPMFIEASGIFTGKEAQHRLNTSGQGTRGTVLCAAISCHTCSRSSLDAIESPLATATA